MLNLEADGRTFLGRSDDQSDHAILDRRPLLLACWAEPSSPSGDIRHKLTFAEQDESVWEPTVGLLGGEGLVSGMLHLHLKVPSRSDQLETEFVAGSRTISGRKKAIWTSFLLNKV